MSDWHLRTGSVVDHPRVRELGRNGAEQARVDAFAGDLAAWLLGAPREELAALARVVTAVGGRSMRDARSVCRDLPLLAIEASARATASLWPLLRDALVAEDGEPERSTTRGEGGGGGGGGAGEPGGPSEPGEEESEAGEDASAQPGADAEDEAAADAEPDPEQDAHDVLQALADGLEVDDPELEALAQALADADDDPGEAAVDALSSVGEQAWDGAQSGEELARMLEMLAPGIGWGTSPGELHATLARRLDHLVELLAKLPELKRIVERLGRMEAADAPSSDTPGGSEEVTGVRLAGEVSGALPSELALLGTEDTEDLFYQRLLERRLVSLELTGAGIDGSAGREGRGPVLACIDTSGSMAGAPEAAAKALVIAVCRRALPQGRTVHLLQFGAKGESTELRLRRGRGGLEQLIDFLTLGFEGGTDFDTPLIRALELIEDGDLERADVLVVTDGYARAAPSVVAAVDDVRARTGLRVWTVVLGQGGVEGVEPFSDEVWTLDPVGGAAVGLTQRVASSSRPARR